MAISSDYPTPVTVNGFSCKNCTDVDYAKKHIDPDHPRSGPYGINAKEDPTVRASQAVTFGGALSNLNAAATSAPAAQGSAQPITVGGQLDLSA